MLRSETTSKFGAEYPYNYGYGSYIITANGDITAPVPAAVSQLRGEPSPGVAAWLHVSRGLGTVRRATQDIVEAFRPLCEEAQKLVEAGPAAMATEDSALSGLPRLMWQELESRIGSGPVATHEHEHENEGDSEKTKSSLCAELRRAADDFTRAFGERRTRGPPSGTERRELDQYRGFRGVLNRILLTYHLRAATPDQQTAFAENFISSHIFQHVDVGVDDMWDQQYFEHHLEPILLQYHDHTVHRGRDQDGNPFEFDTSYSYGSSTNLSKATFLCYRIEGRLDRLKRLLGKEYLNFTTPEDRVQLRFDDTPSAYPAEEGTWVKGELVSYDSEVGAFRDEAGGNYAPILLYAPNGHVNVNESSASDAPSTLPRQDEDRRSVVWGYKQSWASRCWAWHCVTHESVQTAGDNSNYVPRTIGVAYSRRRLDLEDGDQSQPREA